MNHLMYEAPGMFVVKLNAFSIA